MTKAVFDISSSDGPITQVRKYLSRAIDSGVIKSVFGAKPIWAQLKITERCNLNCAYCTEHINDGKQVPLSTVKTWIEKCHQLSVQHIDFIGGEPLLHPDFAEMLRYTRQLKMNSGFTTNGFLLNQQYTQTLIDCGISRLQLSIDTIEPDASTRKAFTLLRSRIDLIRKMNIWVHVNSVLTEDTVSQACDLAKLLFIEDIPVAFSPAHTRGQIISSKPHNRAMIEFFNWLSLKKMEGYPVNMPQYLINYYRDLLSGKPVVWSCEGGCKAFYIDNEGGFRTCSHKPSEYAFANVNKRTLKSYHKNKKGCEDNCGVSCMVLSSLPFNRMDYILQSLRIPKKMRPGIRETRCIA